MNKTFLKEKMVFHQVCFYLISNDRYFFSFLRTIAAFSSFTIFETEFGRKINKLYLKSLFFNQRRKILERL